MKKTLLLSIFLILCILKSNAQLSIPYHNNFTKDIDTAGWTHYALNGNDVWEYGVPKGNNLNSSFSPPYVWATNLGGNFTSQSKICLESPAFDFSDTTTSYRIVFAHQISSSYGDGGNIEYSIDNGQTWHILNGASSDKMQWYNKTSCSGLNGSPAWSNLLYYNKFKLSYHSLDTLSGESNVKFRFKYANTPSSFAVEGWVIDHFSIEENTSNVYPLHTEPIYAFNNSKPIHVSKDCSSFDIKTSVIFYSGFNISSYSNTTKYYWSTDTTLDANDSLLASTTQNINNSTTTFTESLSLPSNIKAGNYYIFSYVDADSNLIENNESDNYCKTTVVVDSTYDTPKPFHFDDSIVLWDKGGENDWQLKPGDIHHYEGTHSGNKAWSIFNTGSYDVNYIESPHLNTSLEDSTLISFWYRSKKDINNLPYYTPIRFKTGCNNNLDNIADIPKMRNNTWDFFNAYLPAKADTSEDVRIRIYNGNGYPDENGYDLVIDDIYIGKARPDLSLEGNKLNRFSSDLGSNDTLHYKIVNSGLKPAPQTVTAFYWSNDSILSNNDILLGTQIEQGIPDTSSKKNQFVYSKHNTAPGKYYIIYKLDTANTVKEMREYNNEGYYVLYQEASANIPYFNDFENQVNGWRHNSTLGKNDWQWASPKGAVLDSTFSGSKVWISNDTGLVTSMSRMHLYTPVFNLQNVNNPVIEFDMKLNSSKGDLELNMSYSIDGGATWDLLDTTSQSFNRWYYRTSSILGSTTIGSHNIAKLMFNEKEKAFVNFEQENSRDTKRNTRYILDIGFLAGIEQVQFRFNLATENNKVSSSFSSYEGALIDNFSISDSSVDLNVDYKKALMMSSDREELKFYMNIKNQGNYMSIPCSTNFYLSKDTILDSNDGLLGQIYLPGIRPDFYHYTNQVFSPIDSIFKYDYLLYELDKNNVNQELDENNNTGYWPLALDSINSYPYYNDFEACVVDGWHQFGFDSTTNSIDDYRFRNYVVPAEANQYNQYHSGEWFTELMPTSSFYTPYMYLESPAFNFNKLDSIFMSFNLLCSGEKDGYSSDGGNFEFSTDGGNTWHLLKDSLGHSHNWYSNNSLYKLDNEPGWTGAPGSSVLDSTAFDLSFLKDKKSVVFRFKYYSNKYFYGSGSRMGIRMDDFRIQGFNVDYVANDMMTPINHKIINPDINLDYSISNTGQSNGRITSTEFYWSEDSIFNTTDSLIKKVQENRIHSGSIKNDSVKITYPSPLKQKKYYVFYKTDADSNLVELNESNNIGSFVIQFDTTNSSSKYLKMAKVRMYAYENELYISIPNNNSEYKYSLELIQANGKILYRRNVNLTKGDNIISLPHNLSNGIYFVRLINKKRAFTKKILLQD